MTYDKTKESSTKGSSSYFQKRCCCWPCVLIVLLGVFVPCVFGGALILGFSGGPDLRRYLEVERHLMPTTCDVISSNQTGSVKCSYAYNCGDHSCQYKNSEYECVRIRVDYTHANGTQMSADLFRSYTDAKKTDFRCSAYECENPREVSKFQDRISKMASFQCWYRVERPEMVYTDTTDGDELAAIVFTLTCGVLLVVVPVTILLAAFVHYNCCSKKAEESDCC